MHNTNIVLLNTKANPTRLLHHYALIQKSGFPTGYHCCWCDAKLEFAVKEKWSSIDRKRRAFFDQHDECEPKESA